ncbi:MAG: dTDP-4-dehydrorhamnose reductase family protein [Flavobacteriaceae bacterium]
MEKIIPKRIMILGSTGMLGHMLFFYLKKNKNFKIYNLSFRKKLNSKSIICDIHNISDLKKILKRIKPEIIINSIGILPQNPKFNKINSIFINSLFPQRLIEISKELNSKIIQISTDCVFDGKRGKYSENDIPNETKTYGLTKILGEIKGTQHLTIRTSIIGPELKKEGKGLLHWVFNENGKIKGYNKAIWGGITTLELSKVIEYCISYNISGLYHVTNGESISKYDLLNLIKREFKLNQIEIIKDSSIIYDRSLISERSDIKYKFSSYDKMISELNLFYSINKDLYSYRF